MALLLVLMSPSIIVHFAQNINAGHIKGMSGGTPE